MAIIILTAILFLARVDRPTLSRDEGTVDLGRIASDTLRILQDRVDPDKPELSQLESWINATIRGDDAEAAEADAFLSEVLPQGTRYVLRLDNGVGAMDLLPPGGGLEAAPRGGRVGTAFLMPNWTAHADETVTETVYPGQTHDHSGWYCVSAPTGTPNGPDNTQWIDAWTASPGVVPASTPFGVWKVHIDASCSAAPIYVRVTLPDGPWTDSPPYGVQLVVWFGA